ncbi:sensor histidine kinase [Acidicapsa ligni]|uniref:sensor histidine kinase n=1 Tax=Acidicapsa ligni TaxID=542300 RepID=UPI0021DFD9C9|nr:HAMP domain-containing sensor histidine kinase [Acidicapsa ligni]
MKSYSITRRLITTILLVEFISALCVSGVALLYEQHMHFRSFDVMLRGRADSLLGAVQDAEDTQDNVMLDGSEVSLPKDDIYEVEDASGRVLGKSANWSRIPSSSSGEPLTLDKDVFMKTLVHGDVYRVVRKHGLRIVDPGDKDGGIRRYVTVYYGSRTKRVWKAVLRAVTFYAISSLALLAITGFLMAWLLNRSLSPLRDLAAGAASVSVTSWTFLPSEDARRIEELAPLVNAIETVLQRLERSFEQQKRFVGDAAHELKTNVAVVKSSLQLLEMKPRTAEEYQAGLQRCLTDCERMEGIVAQMLTLARAEQHSPSISHAIYLVPSIKQVIDDLNTIAETRQIQITMHSPEHLWARIETEQFKLLCANILMNALQHSAAGSTAYVDLIRSGDYAQLRIADQGEGIHPDDLPLIFERFSRGDPSRSRKTGGTGLGLAICKAIVDNVHGTIDVTSELRRGTVVLVQLPLAGDQGESASLFLS